MSFTGLSVATVALLLSSVWTASASPYIARRSPSLPDSFNTALRIPKTKECEATYVNPKTGTPIDFCTLTVKRTNHTFFPSFPPQSITGYDGSFPGPTFRIKRGRETVVRVLNNATANANLHLHGSYTRSPWDGWAGDVLQAGEYKDYYYPNSASGRTLWYHDHAHKESALNVYNGMFGMYQIVDDALDRKLGIESGGKYDVPLMFSSHYFTKNGGLSDERNERTSVYGDTWLVNGNLQPYLQVEPRKYRFRVLNGAISRVLNFTIEANGQEALPMAVVGSDGGARAEPTNTKSLIVGMAERWEIIIDFSTQAGRNLTLRSTSMWTDPAYADSDKVMQFRVGPASALRAATARKVISSPAQNIDLRFPAPENTSAREFRLVSHMDRMWGINSYHMDDSLKRVLMRPALGTVERLIFRSSGMSAGSIANMGSTGRKDVKHDSNDAGSKHGSGTAHQAPIMSSALSDADQDSQRSRTSVLRPSAKFIKRQHHGGSAGSNTHSMGKSYWTHAMHLHLVDMQLISRRKEDPSRPEGRDYLEPYERGAVKDLVLLGSNEVIEVLVKYQPYPGVYMWHCHNEIHENRGMMAVMNVTRLKDFGYSALDTRLEDPMDIRFAPKKWSGTDLDDVRRNVLPMFASLNAYPPAAELEAAIDRYWGRKDAAGTAQAHGTETDGAVVPNIDPEKHAEHDLHHGKGSDGMGHMVGMSGTIGAH